MSNEVLKTVVENQPEPIADSISQVFAARQSNGRVKVALDDKKAPCWLVPEDCNIWKDARRVEKHARDLLEDLGNISYQLSELATWVAAHQYDARVENVEVRPPRTRDDIHRTLWQLEVYLARTDNHSPGKPPASRFYPTIHQDIDKAHEDRHYRMIATEIKEGWLNSLGSDELENIAQVLNTLESGHGQLIRHTIMPQAGTMLQILFGRSDLSMCWTRDLRIRARAYQRTRQPQRPFMGFEQAMEDFRMRGARDDSECGVLQGEDEEAYERYGCTDDSRDRADGEGYLERFRPLIGFPFGSQVPVAQLVGVNAPIGLGNGSLFSAPNPRPASLLSKDLDRWKDVNSGREEGKKREERGREKSKESEECMSKLAALQI
ncbi:hypothetical protein LTR36_010136 [Oleoguttula mirabilis]|uniref:Uncharacterized protein n=1 Tax=Oleoguttula mirabilis TaxID=1507867 RepID=A0AAV9JRK3_9PEZI|nr:hypothetical protein LTR36_010136 [Oleoguttula mirabilis]